MPGDTGGESLQKDPGPAHSRQHELLQKADARTWRWRNESGAKSDTEKRWNMAQP